MTSLLGCPTYPLSSTPAPAHGLFVYLGAVPNFDYAQHGDPRGWVSVAPHWFRVEALAAAQAAVRSFCDKHSLGGGNLVPAYVAKDGQLVAKVSYNGRIWEVADGRETGKELGVTE